MAVVHCGGGIPAVRYSRFARFLAEWGIPVLTYDYRGIGLSRPPQLRGFEATIEDWAEFDSAAAIAWLRERFPHDELVGISHSIGCLPLAGAPNANEQERVVMVGAHTGYFGDYRPLYRLPMALAWHGLMPAITRCLGYFPANRLRLGEDLPAGMALEWARRRGPDLGLRSGDPSRDRRRQLLERCAALQGRGLAICISDDAFATTQGTKRLLSYLPGLSSCELVAYTPSDAGVRQIGHFGFFRRAAGIALWPRLMAQLDPSRVEADQPAIASGSVASASSL